jgi:hypothetical protein
MSKPLLRIALLWPLVCASLLAAEKAEAIVIVADSRRFAGWRAWWVNVYNESHLMFALMTIVTLPLLALILGRITSALMALTGINLKSRELAEH